VSVHNRVVEIVVFAAVATLFLSGCSVAGSERDGGGMAKEEAFALSFEEQYLLAGERYVATNEVMAELQREIFTDEWENDGTSEELVPGSGYSLNADLKTDDRENSYFFSVSRVHSYEGDTEELIREVAASWETKGWDVTVERPFSTIRAVVDTPDGYWVEADSSGGEFVLTVLSPVYWGEQFAFGRAIVVRRDAEEEAGVPGATVARDPETNRATFLPGQYRPFPAWDAVPEGTVTPE